MKIKQISTKVIPLGSTAFRQWRAKVIVDYYMDIDYQQNLFLC